MVSFDPKRPDFEPYGFTCVRWLPTPTRPDHHNEIELNLLQSGWVTYFIGGKKVRFEVGKLGLFWAAIPHQIINYAKGTEYFVATIPLVWFLQCELPACLTQPLMRGEVIMERTSHRAALDNALFGEWETDLLAGSDISKDIVMMEMEARIRRVAEGLLSTSIQKRRKQPLSLEVGRLGKVEQIACLVSQRYKEHLTIAEISKAVKLNPNYVMNLFKKTFGTTLMEYLIQHRISHAKRLLATTNEKVIEIAFASGFNSISRFNEAFRSACGCTPREYRVAYESSETVRRLSS